MYKAVTYGGCFINVTTKEECQEAASQLGFTANETIVLNDSLNVHYASCYANVSDNQLFFNPYGEGYDCNDDIICICKKTSGKH